MNYSYIEEALSAIARFFNSEYKPESIRMVSGAIMPEPQNAMRETYKRCCTEFNTLPPIAKVRDMVIAEGRKIREKEAIEREQEEKQRRLEAPRSLPSGHTEYSRACCDFLKAAMSGYYDKRDLRRMAEEGNSRFPGMGFDAWLDGSLTG